MLLFTARAGRAENGRAAIMVKGEEEEEEDVDKDKRRRREYSGWLRGHHGRFESIGECKSFSTGAMKVTLMKHFISLS